MAWWLFLLLVLLHIADSASTVAVLRYEGGEELNPIAIRMMRRFGVGGGLVMLKLAVVAQLAAWIWFVGADRWLILGLAFVIPVYAIVVVKNIRNWLLARAEAGR